MWILNHKTERTQHTRYGILYFFMQNEWRKTDVIQKTGVIFGFRKQRLVEIECQSIVYQFCIPHFNQYPLKSFRYCQWSLDLSKSMWNSSKVLWHTLRKSHKTCHIGNQWSDLVTLSIWKFTPSTLKPWFVWWTTE